MTDTTDPTKPVAWMHPTAVIQWTNRDRDAVLAHCKKDGPYPIPLYGPSLLSEYEEKKKAVAHLSLTLAKETARSEALEAENKRLREALDMTGVGANHLVASLVMKLGPDFSKKFPFSMNAHEALELIGASIEFDIWCAWASAMKARAALEASR